MKAIILAAGRGERLYPLTRNTPKSLIHLGHGVTILEAQLESLQAAGVHEVAIVCGYRAEQIAAKVELYRGEYGLSIEIVYNPFYEISNNLVSLWLARHTMLGADGIIIINGDDVFKPHVVKNLVAVESDKELVITLSRKPLYDHEDMKVEINGTRIIKVSKDIPLDRAHAESVGIARFVAKGVSLIDGELDRMVRNETNLKVFWLELLNQLIERGWPLHSYEIEDSDWAEIDVHLDMETVVKNLEESVPWLPNAA